MKDETLMKDKEIRYEASSFKGTQATEGLVSGAGKLLSASVILG